jgi:hypothetical protein
MSYARAVAALAVTLTVSVLLIAPSARSSPGASTWTSEVVDPNGGDYPDAAWGPGGPGIAYTLPGGPTSSDSVMYAYRTDTWHVEKVVGNVFAGAANPQLTYDRNGDPWILYQGLFPGGSALLHRTGPGSWQSDGFIRNGLPEDIGMAPDGSIAMVVNRDPYVVYATWDGTRLHTIRIARGVEGSLLFQRGRDPAVAFDDSAGGVSFAVRVRGGWQVSVIDDERNAQAPSLAFAGPNEPVVAYTELRSGSADSNLRLADRNRAGVWRTRPVDTGRKSGIFPSIGTAGGTTYIAYLRGDDNDADLRLATKTSATQEAITLFTGIHIVGGDPALLVDPGGTPHVAFATETLNWGSPA